MQTGKPNPTVLANYHSEFNIHVSKHKPDYNKAVGHFKKAYS
jgi:hypothetical protein